MRVDFKPSCIYYGTIAIAERTLHGKNSQRRHYRVPTENQYFPGFKLRHFYELERARSNLII